MPGAAVAFCTHVSTVVVACVAGSSGVLWDGQATTTDETNETGTDNAAESAVEHGTPATRTPTPACTLRCHIGHDWCCIASGFGSHGHSLDTANIRRHRTEQQVGQR